jgi:thymidylate synthase (FAD)
MVYSFDIIGISRAVLQELARHRTASLTVKSTRYTLKELKDEAMFDAYDQNDIIRAMKYLVFTGVGIVDSASIEALEKLRLVLNQGVSNDKAKYCLPESYKTRLQWTMDGRNLQSFLELRSSKDALWEIRELANKIYEALPANHQFLYSPFMVWVDDTKETEQC